MSGNYYMPFSIRISEDLKFKMTILAKEHKRSTNKEIELAIETYVLAHEREHGEIIIPPDWKDEQ